VFVRVEINKNPLLNIIVILLASVDKERDSEGFKG